VQRNNTETPPNHLGVLHGNSEAIKGTGRNNLLTKTTGSFYTPDFIGRRLVKTVLNLLPFTLPDSRTFRICEPFSGDGRLIVWLIEAAISIRPELLKMQWEIELWDCNANALKTAVGTIQLAASKAGINSQISSFLGDSFTHFLNLFGSQNGGLFVNQNVQKFDLIITNPPWEVIRPDRRDLEILDQIERNRYVSSLRDFSDMLLANFPTSVPKRMFSGWGINLARVGTEIAVRMASTKGVVGIVSPASLLADQSSESLRQWLITKHSFKHIDYFAAETCLFSGVDISCIGGVILSGGQQGKISTSIFSEQSLKENLREIMPSRAFLESNSFVIPIGGHGDHISQLERFANLPTLGDLHGKNTNELWSGRELDETGHASFLGQNPNHPPFLKGRMIERLVATDRPHYSVNPQIAPSLPPSIEYPRIVWRDVSRPTQRRRIQATIIPAGWVTGNSLGVAHLRSNNEQKLRALMGLMSSLPFELQLRALSSTSHVSVGILRKIHMPDLTNQLIEDLSEVVNRRMKGDLSAETELEIIAAQAYGLKQADLSEILESFPKVTTTERQTIIDHPHWITS
jgi:Alw26I/Eco31I/Esp3I family type II restriction m6 adenine DNA methyltransferase